MLLQALAGGRESQGCRTIQGLAAAEARGCLPWNQDDEDDDMGLDLS